MIELRALLSDIFSAQNRNRTILCLILCVAALLRLGYFFEAKDNFFLEETTQQVMFDQWAFTSMAHSLIVDNGLGENKIDQSPAYAFFVALVFALFGFQSGSVYFVQVLIGLGMVWLIYRTALLIFDD